MSFAVRVSATDPTPPYEQLRLQLAGAIEAGTLRAGVRLPTVRQLAADLGLANGTVMRAYRELEASGLVSTKRGAGTTAIGVARPLDPAADLALLAERFVQRARAIGASDQALSDAVGACLASSNDLEAPPTE